MKITKSTVAGPVSRLLGNPELVPIPYIGYRSLEEISSSLEDVQLPDFSQMHSELVRIGDVTISDDPTAMGLKEFNANLAKAAEGYRKLTVYRAECIAIRSEWASLKIDFNRLLDQMKRDGMKTAGYEVCKNVQDRTAYLDNFVSDYNLEMAVVEQALQRCADFVEVCRVLGKGLDALLLVLSKQVEILKIQAKVEGV